MTRVVQERMIAEVKTVDRDNFSKDFTTKSERNIKRQLSRCTGKGHRAQGRLIWDLKPEHVGILTAMME